MDKEEMPEAYREGWVPFLGQKIYLDSHPLIPRVETEWWAELLISHIGDRPVRVLDLCAGSGAIGVAILAHCPAARVSFGEVDSAHLATIWKNIRVNALDASRVAVKIGDLFEPFEGEVFDFVAANPPYVPERRELPVSVADYEPALALRAGEDGLAVIKRIAAELPKHLSQGGVAWVECDSEHAEEARGLFEAVGLSARVMNDQYDRPRVIVISSPV